MKLSKLLDRTFNYYLWFYGLLLIALVLTPSSLSIFFIVIAIVFGILAIYNEIISMRGILKHKKEKKLLKLFMFYISFSLLSAFVLSENIITLLLSKVLYNSWDSLMLRLSFFTFDLFVISLGIIFYKKFSKLFKGRLASILNLYFIYYIAANLFGAIVWAYYNKPFVKEMSLDYEYVDIQSLVIGRVLSFIGIVISLLFIKEAYKYYKKVEEKESNKEIQ